MKPTLTCIVPARNEQGHLGELLIEILTLENITQVVIVEGGSSDDTWLTAQKLAKEYPGRVFAIQQSGKGKFNAVREAALISSSKYIVIWDADGTVPIASSRKLVAHGLATGNFTIGDRLRGNIEKNAMQTANWFGNWMFALLWSPIIKSRPTDIFCGTKIFPASLFNQLQENLAEIDPYGDITLLAAARSANIQIDSIVVNYTSRSYGVTKMRRWKMGARFFKLTVIAYLNLLFPKLK
jgi:glycosyltransferase involved in cell wall biosynthesis